MTIAAPRLLNVRSQNLGYAFAAIGATLFSTKAIFIKLAYQEQVSATLMLAWRMIFSLPFFVTIGALALWQKKRRGEAPPAARSVGFAMTCGVLGYYLAAYFDFAGLQYISAQLERLVLFSYPIMIMFLSYALYGERITRHGILASLITYAGLTVAFLSDVPVGGRDTVLGTLLVLAAALAFAGHQIIAKRVISTLGAVVYTAISMSSAAICCIVHHGVLNAANFSAPPRFLLMAAGCAMFATVMPSLLINASLARISSTSVAMISTLSPIVTIALAVMILGEPFTLADGLGAVLVIAGVALYTRGDRRKISQSGPNELAP